MNSQVAIVFVVLVGLCRCAQIQAGCFGFGRAAEVSECRENMEFTLKDAEVPPELKQVLKNVRGMMPNLFDLPLTKVVLEHLDVSKYMAEQSKESVGRLVDAAREFKTRAQNIYLLCDCPMVELEKLTQLDGPNYSKYVDGNMIIDDFNAYNDLAKKVDAAFN